MHVYPPFPRFLPAALHTGLVILGLSCGAAAHADGAEPSAWSVSGFGTLGIVHASEEKADFVNSILKVSGAGGTRRWSIDVDSRLGAQLNVKLAPQWSAVMQVVSEQHLDNSYRPHVEWANVTWQATPDLALRLGRITLPFYMAAEHRKVGYVYAPVRLPVEVYGGVPIASSDGVDVSYRWRTGTLRHTSRAMLGHTDMALSDELHLRAHHLEGLSHTIEHGALSVRASAIRADLTVELGAPLFDGFDRFGPPGQAIASQYRVDHKSNTAVALGFEYDPGSWFVTAEGGRQRSPSIIGASRAAHVIAGYRWRDVTPFVGYAKVRPDVPTTSPGLPLAGLPPPLAGAGAALNGGLNMLLAAIPRQSTVSAGVRWDLARNTALKLQYDRVTPTGGSRGTLINTLPGFVSGRTNHVASMALDFVF